MTTPTNFQVPSLPQDYTYQYTSAGVALNTDVTPMAPFVDVQEVDGLDSAPVRSSQRAREGADGSFIDARWEDGRTIVISCIVYSPPDSVETFMDALKENYAPSRDPQPFFFRHPTVGTRMVMCKSLGVRANVDQLRRTGSTIAQITLQSEDPRIYSGTATIVTGGIASSASGRSYPRSYNYGYGSTNATAGGVIVNNLGNRDTPAIITLAGLVNPELVHDTTGSRMTFNITLAGSDVLQIDLAAKTVLLNGGTRRSVLNNNSRWFLLQKGVNSIRLLGSPSDSTPIMSVAFRPAYR
jgi:hypothetical protein